MAQPKDVEGFAVNKGDRIAYACVRDSTPYINLARVLEVLPSGELVVLAEGAKKSSRIHASLWCGPRLVVVGEPTPC